MTAILSCSEPACFNITWKHTKFLIVLLSASGSCSVFCFTVHGLGWGSPVVLFCICTFALLHKLMLFTSVNFHYLLSPVMQLQMVLCVGILKESLIVLPTIYQCKLHYLYGHPFYAFDPFQRACNINMTNNTFPNHPCAFLWRCCCRS